MVFAILDLIAGLSAAAMVQYADHGGPRERVGVRGDLYRPSGEGPEPCQRLRERRPPSTAGQLLHPGNCWGFLGNHRGRLRTHRQHARPGGVYDSAAGTEIGRLLLGARLRDRRSPRGEEADLVYPHRINPLTTEPGLPRYVDGSRTLKGDGNFLHRRASRGDLHRAKCPAWIGLRQHRNNDESLRAQVRRTITAFLIKQMNNSAFRSRVPAQAFFVDGANGSTPRP